MTPDEARRIYLGALLTVAPESNLVAVTAGGRRAACLPPRPAPAPPPRRRDRGPHRAAAHHDDADADCLATIDEAIPFLVNESARVRLLGLERVG